MTFPKVEMSLLLIGEGAEGSAQCIIFCRKLVAEGKKPQVILGFNKVNEVFFENGFKVLGAEVTVTTADGSYGMKRASSTDALKNMKYTYIYSCGPRAYA